LQGLIAVAALAAVVLAGCGARLRAHHPKGPPVTAEALKRSIERSGLKIEWHDGKPGGRVIAELAGEARDPRTGGHVAFELALTKGHAHARDVGRSRYPLSYHPDSGSPVIVHFDEPGQIEPVLRGTIRNVAYANWFYAADDEYASEEVSARLDQAIMDAFASDDAEAHPILESAPE
jgi:hypothetical protein